MLNRAGKTSPIAASALHPPRPLQQLDQGDGDARRSPRPRPAATASRRPGRRRRRARSRAGSWLIASLTAPSGGARRKTPGQRARGRRHDQRRGAGLRSAATLRPPAQPACAAHADRSHPRDPRSAPSTSETHHDPSGRARSSAPSAPLAGCSRTAPATPAPAPKPPTSSTIRPSRSVHCRAAAAGATIIAPHQHHADRLQSDHDRHHQSASSGAGRAGAPADRGGGEVRVEAEQLELLPEEQRPSATPARAEDGDHTTSRHQQRGRLAEEEGRRAPPGAASGRR